MSELKSEEPASLEKVLQQITTALETLGQTTRQQMEAIKSLTQTVSSINARLMQLELKQ